MNRYHMLPLRPYGSDPYNTLDACELQHFIVSHYHGPLTPIAYRNQAHWDFAPGVSCAAKLAARQAAAERGATFYQPHQSARAEVPAFLKRQAD
jgi:hypothetical protein